MQLASLALSISGLFNPKIKRWNHQRNKDFKELKTIKQEAGNRSIVWMHCASLGEYEQGVELIKAMKKQGKNEYYLLSFFSPSGYESSRVRKEVDKVIYLPMDTKHNAKTIMNLIVPKYLIGVKYEFWWNMINEALALNAKVIYISVLLQENNYLFKKWASVFREKLTKSDIYTQDENTKTLLAKYGISSKVTGDTRIVSIIERRKAVQENQVIKNLLPQEKKVLVYGSIYLSDLPVLKSTIMNEEYFHILVPHNIDKDYIHKIASAISIPANKYSDINIDNCNAIIVDKVGLLFDIYQYADVVYIGGGFEKSIHNTLEPAVYGIPIAFGPKNKTFIEAQNFLKNGIAKEITSSHDFEDFITTYCKKEKTEIIKTATEEYFEKNKDSVRKIMDNL